MNNGNSSKQVLLSVLGIAVLVIAVVGVSFAFFTYSKTGENQLLTTGTIFFQFTDGDSIKLTNQFPISDAEGAAFTAADHKNDGDTFKPVEGSVMTFTVIGHDSSGKGIDYTITAVPGEGPTQAETLDKVNGGEPFTRTPLKDNEVKLYIKQVSSENAGESSKNFEQKFGDQGSNTFKHVSDDFVSYDEKSAPNGALKAGVLLGTGHITATSKDTQQVDKYELRMWISSDTKIGDADTDDYTSDAFAQKYYAVKIKIDAKTAATVTP